MTRRISLLTVTFIASLLLWGCTSSYVDPQYKNVTMADIKAPAEKYRIRLHTEFQTNGTPNERATKLFTERAREALEKTGVVVIVAETDTAPAADLRIVMNNVGDVGAAAAKGFGTGLTFGLVGSMVTDGYVFDASYTPQGGNVIKRHYKHAIHTTVGNAEGPKGLTPMSVGAAFEKVVNDLMMVLIRDLQAEGQLSRIETGPWWRQTALLSF